MPVSNSRQRTPAGTCPVSILIVIQKYSLWTHKRALDKLGIKKVIPRFNFWVDKSKQEYFGNLDILTKIPLVQQV